MTDPRCDPHPRPAGRQRRPEQPERGTGQEGNGMERPHDVSELTAGELERARRELAASLALARPGSPISVPVMARIRAIDAELARRADAPPPPTGSRRLSTPRSTSIPSTGPASTRSPSGPSSPRPPPPPSPA
jgi:hypothetical protein